MYAILECISSTYCAPSFFKWGSIPIQQTVTLNKHYYFFISGDTINASPGFGLWAQTLWGGGGNDVQGL